ncbi:Tn3 family transposase [Streptomyces sp. NPDC057909]|uniref:Tn3 family transposase n=1 Tax=Streptomyces sp. NPDC057909 TaxID=3346277 RepID=UPI0036E880F6
MFASEVVQNNDPEDQEKIIKFNEPLANRLTFHTAVDITKMVNDLIDEGWQVDPAAMATITPYITSKTRRLGTPGTWTWSLPDSTRSGSCGWPREPADRARHHGGMDNEREVLTEDEINDLLDGTAEDADGTWDDGYEWTTR